MRQRSTFRPFATRGRGAVIAIIAMFALFSAISVALSIRETSRSHHRATVVEIAGRQRTLAERYVRETMRVESGVQADPATTATLLRISADALIDGGRAPAVNGDDDETALPAATGLARRQLLQARRLVNDLTASGSAWMAGRPLEQVRLTANEKVTAGDPARHLEVLAALTSNVSLDAARTIAASADSGISSLIVMQVTLGIAGLIAALMLALALTAATRRQSAHFRSLVSASTDLVLVFGDGGCRYASQSFSRMVGVEERELHEDGYTATVHPDDRGLLASTCIQGEPSEIVFRIRNRLGEWRHVEAHVTDMRNEQHVRGVVLNGRDVSERLVLEEELTRQAFHDGLTGLANRALFRDRLDHALARRPLSGEPLALLLVDLDGFKQINDNFGHDVGDQLLLQVAARFEDVTRPSDTVARFGGDEFAVLVEGGEQFAIALAERLLKRLSLPATVADRTLAFGASIGIVVDSGDGETGREELIRRADIAMYAAKNAGRGRYEVFRGEMAREFGETLGLEYELRLGLQHGEFSLHYQPEIEVVGGAIVGVEALLRWTSPTLGSVSPGEFIAAAEATGMIMQLGELALREACEQTARWEQDGLLPERFTTWVNLSGTQLSAGGIDKLVRTVLAETGVPPRRLGLEVTETAIVQGGSAGERAREELQALHQDGVSIAIDDFGTGFSSLGQLRRFPIDMIKVDRSFIQGAAHDPRDAAITANVVSLAHALGLVAMAEGIESEAQLASLRELGCDLAQGFLFARAVPPAELAGLLDGAARDLRRAA
ncbi:MAG: EAL domain-containing protein [Actinomycetota bacterium]|nr:EAL domain-containing protein [Actinomycetota bacterium]